MPRGVYPRTEQARLNIKASKQGEKNNRWGKKHTEETKRKISQSLIGHPGAFTGRKHTIETIKKMKAAKQGHPTSDEARERMKRSHMGLHCGEKNGMWNGGTSFEPYCPKFNQEFRMRVREFFNNTCVLCGVKWESHDKKFHVHHVNYDKQTCCNDTKPLFVLLCDRCHGKTRSKYNKENFEVYFTKLIIEKYNGQCYLPKKYFI